MTDDDPTRQLDDQVEGCAHAHQVLLGDLDDLVEREAVDPTTPSLLPGWTIGHVLTHLARNADGFRNMIEGAAAGEVRSMYVSAERREADIEAGSSRTLAELLVDVRTAAWALESSWARLSVDAWQRHGLTRTGPTPIVALPWRRWREVEVHHSDLGLTFTPQQWSSRFVDAALGERAAEFGAEGGVLPDDVVAAAPWQRLAWLLGRPCGLSSAPPSWA